MAQRLTRFRLLPETEKDIRAVVSAVNEDRTIEKIPIPTNMIGAGGSGYAVISWDDVANKYRPDLDGARIWRAAAADDNNTSFYDNNSKALLVSCIRSTSYTDVQVAAGDYVYWVMWVNLEGIESPVAGGVTVTVT